ncbi:MAG: hypothetical protein COU90_03505 [Candidatus Ryanbacteria bacterium CG10_big_fil_rev_8_21_14_0_10_43_42]|uniref:CvpA family protein n=1 Tax=Candidatus Ryanbacteria bacterium CG10_big_fil_rev_8_21_14_0_10_43_42 TaxID=1974864 RepID=A0A2M8KX55_9BACT|nr:MAG: hypothetical protein COU90_03505 [Candidatus Ryanbacteria bacterium CG10_big_fil_rev_8_21_14_0_10_43_42]
MVSRIGEFLSLVQNRIPSWDVLIVFFLITAGFFYGILIGRLRLLASLLGLYISILIHPYIIGMAFFPVFEDVRIRFGVSVGVFITFLFLVSLLLLRSLFKGQRRIGEEWWHALILGVFGVGLFVSFVVRLVPSEYGIYISPLTHTLFRTDMAFLIWLSVPLVGMLITRKRLGD